MVIHTFTVWIILYEMLFVHSGTRTDYNTGCIQLTLLCIIQCHNPRTLSVCVFVVNITPLALVSCH